MLSLTPFRADHFYKLDIQPAQRWAVRHVGKDLLAALESNGWSTTILKNGAPVFVGGVLSNQPHIATVWCYVGLGMSPQEFAVVHKHVVRFIESLPYRRLDMVVSVKHEEGHRWAKLLGFTCEAKCMSAFLINGDDAALYAKVKGANRG